LDSLHKQFVEQISRQVRAFFDGGQPFRVYHGSTNSTRTQSFGRENIVDVSGLSRIISIDTKAMTALVEPNVPMDQFVAATLRYGLVPPVVMEFPGITVGGGLQGGAGESSSYKWGCFNRTLNWYEMVLGNGEVITVSSEENEDLYYGAAGAYGSLGVVTVAEVKLVKAGKYAVLEYIPVSSFDQAVGRLKKCAQLDLDFVDGIMFSKNRGVIVCGRMADTPVGPVKHYRHAWNQWFYLGVEAAIRQGEAVSESVPLVDYLFRYDRGAFWTGKYAFRRFGVPFNRFTRWLFNPFFKTRRMYIALEASGLAQEYIVQDLSLSETKAAELMDWIDTATGIYPLWLCPFLPDTNSLLLPNNLSAEFIVNVGVWGPGPKTQSEFVDQNRALEDKVSELGGRKWLYAHAYYPEPMFWGIYDKNRYDALRTKYHAATLLNVYDKTHVGEQQRVSISGKRGVLWAIIGRKFPG
jgi:FAD/FMN-containing dehydrogenase